MPDFRALIMVKEVLQEYVEKGWLVDTMIRDGNGRAVFHYNEEYSDDAVADEVFKRCGQEVSVASVAAQRKEYFGLINAPKGVGATIDPAWAQQTMETIAALTERVDGLEARLDAMKGGRAEPRLETVTLETQGLPLAGEND